MLQLRKAERKKVKLRMSIASPTGYGKTYSALLIAYGITGDWSKVAVIDSENDSASLYSDLGDFNTIQITAPFTVEKYVEALKICEDNGIEVAIIDSLTHVWKGEGGVLDYQNKLGGRFQDWAKANPVYQKLINAILFSSCHVITTLRKKMGYEITEDKKVKKIGLEDEIRDGFAYEMTIGFELINDKHLCYTSKDRTRLFEGKPEFIISSATGEMIRDWCESGKDTSVEIKEGIAKLKNCSSIEDMQTLVSILPSYVIDSAEFKTEGAKRKLEIKNKQTV